MSLSTVSRLVLAHGLALGVVVAGCGDNDRLADIEDGDDGGMGDAGPGQPDGGGRQDSGLPTVSCGEHTCEGALLISTSIAPCCVLDESGAETSVCGLKGEDIKKTNPLSPFTGCVPKDVPYASLSEYCGEFFDQVELDGDHTNGGLDIKTAAGTFVFEGCCLPSGECGADIRAPRGISADVLDSHLGCVSFGRLSEAFGGADGGALPTPAKLPFCVPDTGESPTSGTISGYPEFVCGCGVGAVDSGQGLPCFNNLPSEVCGADAPTADELAQIPEFVCGCTADSKLPCLNNLAAHVCGTKEISADSQELDQVPQFICGALGAAPTRLPLLANVEASVCGRKVMTADSPELDDVPEFICGEQGSTEQHLPLLRNVDAAVCGRQAITQESAALDEVPEFICGEQGSAEQHLSLLRNVEAAVCGRKEISAESAELSQIPQFVCGAEGAVQTPLPLLRNVPSSLCGTKVMTADSDELSQVPEFICGELNGPYTSLPTLRNIESTICGRKPVSAESAELAAVPEFVCGCDDETIPQTVCLRNVEASLCGTRETEVDTKGTSATEDDCLIGVPEYAFGCGPDQAPSAGTPASAVCLRHAETLFGCVDTVVETQGTESPDDDCLRGVPEYLAGCGEGAVSGTPGCLPFAAASFGCVNTTVSPRTVAEHICGCGDALTDLAQPPPAYPCLSRVNVAVCGGVSVTTSTQASGVPNDVCGCGDGVFAATGCVKNVPETVCGAVASCDGCPDTCIDSNGDTIQDSCPPQG